MWPSMLSSLFFWQTSFLKPGSELPGTCACPACKCTGPIKRFKIDCVDAPLSRSTYLTFSLFFCNNSVSVFIITLIKQFSKNRKKSFLTSRVYEYRGRISCVALISWLSGATANHPFLFYDDISGTIFLSFFSSSPLPLQIFNRGVSLRNILLQLVTHLKFPGWNDLLSFPLKHSYQPYLLLQQNNIHQFHMLLNSSVLFYE